MSTGSTLKLQTAAVPIKMETNYWSRVISSRDAGLIWQVGRNLNHDAYLILAYWRLQPSQDEVLF